MKSPTREGFTLVELLVVIAIIGVLVALLLPAVQAAREAARRTQCSNQLRQIAIAVQGHHDVHQILPSAGWGWRWTADPDRGFGKSQSGSWAYSTLPFMEARAIHQIGAGITDPAQKKTALARLAATPVSTFYCPSRRPAAATANVNVGLANTIYNADNPEVLARSDYAANLGPEPEVKGAGWPSGRVTQWYQGPVPPQAEKGQGFVVVAFPQFNVFEAIQGVGYQYTEFNLKHITDGTTNTYLVGEKFLNPDFYVAGEISPLNYGDDQGAWSGDDLDNFRNAEVNAPPLRDQAGIGGIYSFGSAHPATFQMSMCDASVRGISYDIDPTVHTYLGTRAKDDVIPGGLGL